MLLKLLPDQVVRYWEFIGQSIYYTLPPIVGESPERMNNILASILAGGLTVWMSYSIIDSIKKVSGIVVTQIVADEPSLTKTLLIYSIYAPDGFGDQEWIEGFRGLSEYAKSRGCARITAYTINDQIIKRAEQFGGDTSYRFISVPI